MKKTLILRCFLFFGAILLFNSCSDNDDDTINSESIWQLDTKLVFEPVEDKETFIWYYDLQTKQEYWGNDEVEINMRLKSKNPAKDFSKVDFYITVEEKDGYNYSTPFNTDGKMIGSAEIPESGAFTFSLGADEAYGVYENDFQKDRSSTLAREGDIFLLYYVITAKDGSTLDSRESIRESNRYAMKVRVEDFAPPLFEGTFEFEWIELSGGAITYGGVWLGKTGTVNITHDGEGVYSMSNLLWDYKYGGKGKVYYDFLDGLTYVQGSYQEKWSISNLNGASMDIAFTYQYSDAYDETGTVRFTRTDGTDWPSNIYTED
ncbi:hypothetical protein F6U93_07615 [Tamlana haliotis]|uniref:Uncharacterized protein n=1 Tax=Pseudotamlana haliotis TaxID=2614804 RepID=A0A6N6MGT8_9FLAO|nr:hypothetical protein [Tamlana haliotis]KAB1068157.1 hypothetical protein F6U93_07615 [Tamlana haliotis]